MRHKPIYLQYLFLYFVHGPYGQDSGKIVFGVFTMWLSNRLLRIPNSFREITILKYYFPDNAPDLAKIRQI